MKITSTQKLYEALCIVFFALTFSGLILENDVVIVLGIALFIGSLVMVGGQERAVRNR